MTTRAPRIFSILLISALSIIAIGNSGCASFGKKMKSYFAGDNKKPEASNKEVEVTTDGFDRDAMGQVPQRRYGRMTRNQMESEAHLNPRAGSLWRTEGQGAYLFSENNFRVLGDLLNVKLDGAPHDQLVSKAKIIRELTKKLERRPATAQNGEQGKPEGDAAAPGAGETKTAETKPADKPAGPGQVNTDEIDASGDQKPMPVEVVPTRVIERLADGNYRVEGSQSFMVGKREYKVLVAGIVRAQDFNDEFVPATRLMDPKFDIIATKKPSVGLLK